MSATDDSQFARRIEAIESLLEEKGWLKREAIALPSARPRMNAERMSVNACTLDPIDSTSERLHATS